MLGLGSHQFIKGKFMSIQPKSAWEISQMTSIDFPEYTSTDVHQLIQSSLVNQQRAHLEMEGKLRLQLREADKKIASYESGTAALASRFKKVGIEVQEKALENKTLKNRCNQLSRENQRLRQALFESKLRECTMRCQTMFTELHDNLEGVDRRFTRDVSSLNSHLNNLIEVVAIRKPAKKSAIACFESLKERTAVLLAKINR